MAPCSRPVGSALIHRLAPGAAAWELLLDPRQAIPGWARFSEVEALTALPGGAYAFASPDTGVWRVGPGAGPALVQLGADEHAVALSGRRSGELVVVAEAGRHGYGCSWCPRVGRRRRSGRAAGRPSGSTHGQTGASSAPGSRSTSSAAPVSGASASAPGRCWARATAGRPRAQRCSLRACRLHPTVPSSWGTMRRLASSTSRCRPVGPRRRVTGRVRPVAHAGPSIRAARHRPAARGRHPADVPHAASRPDRGGEHARGPRHGRCAPRRPGRRDGRGGSSDRRQHDRALGDATQGRSHCRARRQAAPRGVRRGRGSRLDVPPAQPPPGAVAPCAGPRGLQRREGLRPDGSAPLRVRVPVPGPDWRSMASSRGTVGIVQRPDGRRAMIDADPCA